MQKNTKTMRKLQKRNKQGHFLRPTLGKIVLTILFLVVIGFSFFCWGMDGALPLHCFVSVPLGIPFYLFIFPLLWVSGDGLGFLLGWLLSIFFYYALASALVALWKKVRHGRKQ